MSLKQGRLFMGRFNFKSDLLLSLTDFCKKENIRLGICSVIGALSNVRLGYYDQDKKKYVELLRRAFENLLPLDFPDLEESLNSQINKHSTQKDLECYLGD